MALPATFTVAAALDEAWERIGKDPSLLTGRHIISAQRSIRLMLVQWNNDGILFIKVTAGLLHTVALAETSFVAATGVIDILDAALRRSSLDSPMLMLSRAEWFNLPDKLLAQAMPDRFWVERIASPPTVHFYPMAENATDVIIYDAVTRFNDSSALAAAPDVQELWLEAFVSGLTAYLAEKFAPHRFIEKMALYGGPGKRTGAYAVAKMGNAEKGDLQFTMPRRRR